MASVKSSSSMAILAIALVFMGFVGQCHGQLKVGYYKGNCSNYDVEYEVYKVVGGFYATDKTITAALLRMLFHDAFAGTDASLLLDGPEKSEVPNKSVRGYEIIDKCKASLEAKCPGVVSCTDILLLATRASIYLTSGTWFDVETGRRDCLTSSSENALALPGPTTPVKDLVAKFVQRGLTATDVVLLVGGGHTIGIIHCDFFVERLYNFSSTGRPDPSINPTTLTYLKSTCPLSGSTNYASADQYPGSAMKFDTGFYQAIRQGKGLLVVDQRLASDPLTRDIVKYFASSSNFISQFAASITRLTRYGALTGTNGQIRRNCHRANCW